MDKEDFIKKMTAHGDKFDALWSEIVKDVNNFIIDHPNCDFQYTKVEKITDTFCLSGAWILDRLNGYSGLPSSATYKKSLSKKIRKALGYTY